jgi:hypothetical protein
MNNSEKLATLGTRDTGHGKKRKKEKKKKKKKKKKQLPQTTKKMGNSKMLDFTIRKHTQKHNKT